MIEVLGSKRVYTRNSVYLLVLVRAGGKLKCICKKIDDHSVTNHSTFPIGWVCEGSNLSLGIGRQMMLGNLITSEVLRIENVK